MFPLTVIGFEYLPPSIVTDMRDAAESETFRLVGEIRPDASTIVSTRVGGATSISG